MSRALREHGHHSELPPGGPDPPGVKVYVPPSHYEQVLEHLRTAGVAFGNGQRWLLRDLRPRHVVASDELRDVILRAVGDLQKVREQWRAQFVVTMATLSLIHI